jgi:pimeloyl-ACP methyl ester carboxylesterase
MANPSPKLLLGIVGAALGAAVGVATGVAAVRAIRQDETSPEDTDATVATGTNGDADDAPSEPKGAQFGLRPRSRSELVSAQSLAREDSRFLVLDDLEIHAIGSGRGAEALARAAAAASFDEGSPIKPKADAARPGTGTEANKSVTTKSDSTATDFVPVICIHGIAASVVSWRPLMAALDAQVDFVAFDRPAFGLSARPLPIDDLGEVYHRDGGPYTLERSVTLVWELADAIGAERVVLLGHSQGGTIAAMAAIRHPERVGALVLEAPALDLVIPNAAFGVLGALNFGGLGSRIVRSLDRLDSRYFAYIWHDATKIEQSTMEDYREPVLIERWHDAFWEHVRSFRMPKFGNASWSQLRDVPVLLVTGDEDAIVPSVATQHGAQRMRAAGVDCELAVIPACGHIAHEEQTAQFAQILRAFLRRHKLIAPRSAA